jgi:thermitase
VGFSAPAHGEGFVPGQLIVDLKHEHLPITPVANGEGIITTSVSSIDTLNALYGVRSFERIYRGRWQPLRGSYLLGFPDSLDVNRIASAYALDQHVRFAVPNQIAEFDVAPIDSFYPQQWGLHKIKCPEAWRYTNGSPYVIIEIIDNCIDFGHPDLVHNIWQNLGEDLDGDGHTVEWDPATNTWTLDEGDLDYAYDEDQNGFTDDLVGWDFEYNDINPECYPGGSGGTPDHGTSTAGIAAAVTNNYITAEEAGNVCGLKTGTVAGTVWFSKVMPIRFWGAQDEMFAAIGYGVDNGARIISMSFSYAAPDSLAEAIIDSAWDAGLLMIASAGNQGADSLRYPASYTNVIAVAGTESNDVKATNSNWSDSLDICAPYRAVTTDRDNVDGSYCYRENFAGTSASAPYVAGVAAMVWSCNLLATNQEVRDVIISTADNIYGIPGNYPYYGKLGSGRVNALRAVQQLRPGPPPPGDANTDFYINVGDVVYPVTYIYKAGPPPDPWCAGDATDDALVDVGDVVYLVNYLYHGGDAPLDGCD